MRIVKDILWGFVVGMGLVSMFVFAKANAAYVNPQTAFAPINHELRFPSADPHADAISHGSFDKAIDLVYNHYAPLLAQQGWQLQFNRLWSDPTVNSDTYHQGRTIIINSYGGLARYPGMNTIAAYAQVACHELGHTMGGAPRFSDGSGMSVEGQADRFAMTCMRAIGFHLSQLDLATHQLSCVLGHLEGSGCPTGNEVLPPYRGIEEDHPPAACRWKEYMGAARGLARNKCWYNP